MKTFIAALVLLTSFQIFSRDHQEDRGRAERGREQRRRNEERRREEERRRREGTINIFDISNTATLTSYTFDEKVEAEQIINDAQDFIQTGILSALLNQKVNEVQKDDENLSLEDALDLIVSSAGAKL